MSLGQKPCEVSHRFTGRYFQPNFDGTDNQVFEKLLVKQYPAQGHCFLSLRQLSDLPGGFENQLQNLHLNWFDLFGAGHTNSKAIGMDATTSVAGFD
jgi:hypothetical protein